MMSAWKFIIYTIYYSLGMNILKPHSLPNNYYYYLRNFLFKQPCYQRNFLIDFFSLHSLQTCSFFDGILGPLKEKSKDSGSQIIDCFRCYLIRRLCFNHRHSCGLLKIGQWFLCPYFVLLGFIFLSYDLGRLSRHWRGLERYFFNIILMRCWQICYLNDLKVRIYYRMHWLIVYDLRVGLCYCCWGIAMQLVYHYCWNF